MSKIWSRIDILIGNRNFDRLLKISKYIYFLIPDWLIFTNQVAGNWRENYQRYRFTQMYFLVFSHWGWWRRP